MDVVSSTNTRVIEVNGQAVTQPQYAVAANEPFNYPNCRDYTPDDTSKSWWDEGIGDSYGYFAGTPADWIWNTPGPVQPITGDVVKFQEKFTIPGYPMIGFLFITADNGFEAVLNGERVGSRQIGPGFPDTLREQVGTDTLPQTGDWGVAANGWQSVGDYSLTGLVIGENTLDITAANEYMWNDGGYSGADFHYDIWDPTVIIADPDPGDGIEICNNPAGLIYRAFIRYRAVDRQETAWADGDPFWGKNWATYFIYKDEPD
jgi:hypothetical protein